MAAKQYKIRRLALPSIAIDHFHYPKRDAIALAIRIIRRFMEHFSESFDSIILVADSVAESNLIIEMLSIYFPRTDNDCSIQLKMETFSPMMIGGRFGEPIHPERNIRIKENPIESLQFSQEWNLHSPSSSFCSTTSTSSDFTSSSSLNYYNSQTSNDEQFESSLTNSIGKTKFARMREHCRDSRFIRSGSQFDIEFDHSMFGDFHRKLRFERLCRNVRRKQLSSPTNVREHFFLDCAIYISGLDRHSRPILSIDCSRINELILTDRLLVHIIQLFEQLSHHQSFIIHIFNCNSLEIDTNIINFLYKLNSFITDSIRSKIDSILVTNYTIWNRLQFWLTKTKQYTENKLRKQKTNDPLIWLRSRK
ncbi:Ganglioside-induced differentiation-associated protein 2 [Blomia tropicalis]|nr:Ganglioside-induced differentiation-associated protein 2 [Blomia tropicalis]